MERKRLLDSLKGIGIIGIFALHIVSWYSMAPENVRWHLRML